MSTSKQGKDDTMKKETLGARIAALRKTNGMTQQQLAEQMGVTDKAVSKWERDLSCPDVTTIPHLAEVFGITVDELMTQSAPQASEKKENIREIVALILKAVPLAMGVAVVALGTIGKLDVPSALNMLGLGLACLALGQLTK